MSGEGTGHDWWHVDRVRKLARRIARTEGGDLYIINLAALLHDLDDWKFRRQGQSVNVKRLLQKFKVDKDTIKKVLEITENISFKLGTNKHKMMTIEGKVVQDADRLDAIGAIGIARLFAFGGKFGRQIHDPEKKVKLYKSLRNFKWTTNTSLHHFNEKLIHIKDRMNTVTGKRMARRRHSFLEVYLKEFYKDWDANQ